MRHLAVDIRMWSQSGIGTYLQAILPRVVEYLRPERLTLVSRDSSEHPIKGAEYIYLRSDVYSPTEPLELSRAVPNDCSAFWSPHFNVPWVCRRPLVVTVHDAFYLHPRFRKTVRADKLLYATAALSRVAANANAILTVSQFQKLELSRLLPGIQASITVVPNAVDSAWHESAGASPIQEPYILAVGNLKPHKNLSALLQGFAGVASSINHRLVLVGATGFAGGTGVSPEVIATLGERLEFRGKVSFAELRSLVGGASAMAFVSLYEGFGLPPLEAMAMGVPVLASREASVPEVCGNAAQYCDARDPRSIGQALLALLSETDAERESRKQRGFERVAQFSWDQSARLTADVIRSVASDE